MKIYITGSPRNITKAEARAVMKWMASEMKVDRYRVPIWIYLKFKTRLQKRNGYKGSAIWSDRNHRPKEFIVEIDDSLSKQLSISTILHEMVHVRQYAKGELKDYQRTFYLRKWGSREVNILKTRYKEYPWEKEAWSLEKIYYEKWREYNKKKRG